jgi:hypothetical protein
MSDRFEQGHACVIGVGGDSPTTVGDAEGLAKILRNPERCAYPETQVRLLKWERSPRSHIISALEWVVSIASVHEAHISDHSYQIPSFWNSVTCYSMGMLSRICLKSRYRAIDLWQSKGMLKCNDTCWQW